MKNQGRRSNGSGVRVGTDRQTDGRTDVTKRIISPASRSIKMLKNVLDNVKGKITVAPKNKPENELPLHVNPDCVSTKSIFLQIYF